jgi:hypothetical protein
MPYRTFGLILFISLLQTYPSFGQDSSFVEQSLSHAIASYTTSVRDQSLLFNGVEYKSFPEPYEGHPFFESEYIEEGSITYYGEYYQNVPMQYDLVHDELIIEHYDQKGYVGLVKLHQKKISSFALLDHTFVRVGSQAGANIRDGFYDLLYDGDVKILSKRKKSIAEDLSQQHLTVSFPIKNSYYLFKENKYYPIRNKGSLLKALKDKRKDLNQFANKNKASFSSNKEYGMIKLAEYYDQISR